MRFFFPAKERKDATVVHYVQAVFGFKPKNIDFYRVALIHKSVSQSNKAGGLLNNERLEYLGDAILGAIVADFLFRKYPLAREGDLSEMRAKIVCRNLLNRLSKQLHIDTVMLIESHTQAKSAAGNAFEALCGAIYLDQGYKKTQKIIINKILLMHLDIEAILREEINFKNKVLSWGQKQQKQITFINKMLKYSNHVPLFRVKLMVNEKVVAVGENLTIKGAEQEAAAQFWQTLKKEIKAE
ncbi:MAG: ribonuclease III [Bacteroidales bacterium]|jgi:ribonuclease-3|nr:ribonuclease III [Bacteroidales bacterium]